MPETLSTLELADKLGVPLRTAQWRVAQWRKDGTGNSPRVVTRKRGVGGLELAVDSKSLEEFLLRQEQE